MADRNDNSKALAWEAVWDALHKFNPAFAQRTSTGLQCALKEIARLQDIARSADLDTKAKQTTARIVEVLPDAEVATLLRETLTFGADLAQSLTNRGYQVTICTTRKPFISKSDNIPFRTGDGLGVIATKSTVL